MEGGVLWLRSVDSQKEGSEVFGKLKNCIMEKSGEGKMGVEINK